MQVAKKLSAGLLAFGLCLSVQGRAADETNPVPGASEMEKLGSTEFLQAIHASNLGEIKMGQLALDRGVSDDVKEYGRIIIRDHSLADELVRFVANKKGIELDDKSFTPAALQFKTQLDQGMMNLEMADDATFRGTFVTVAKEGHQQTLDLIKRAENEVPDLLVRGIAFTLEPVIKNHARLVDKIEMNAE